MRTISSHALLQCLGAAANSVKAGAGSGRRRCCCCGPIFRSSVARRQMAIFVPHTRAPKQSIGLLSAPDPPWTPCGARGSIFALGPRGLDVGGSGLGIDRFALIDFHSFTPPANPDWLVIHTGISAQRPREAPTATPIRSMHLVSTIVQLAAFVGTAASASASALRCPRSGKPTTLNFVEKGPPGFPLDLYRSLVFDNFFHVPEAYTTTCG